MNQRVYQRRNQNFRLRNTNGKIVEKEIEFTMGRGGKKEEEKNSL